MLYKQKFQTPLLTGVGKRRPLSFLLDSLLRFSAPFGEELERGEAPYSKPAPQGTVGIRVHLGNHHRILVVEGHAHFLVCRGQPLAMATPLFKEERRFDVL